MGNRIEYLVEYLNECTKAYDEGHPLISDLEWDNLYFELVELEKKTGIILPNSPTQIIPFALTTPLRKVKHNHPMLSLDKTKDWSEFVRYFGDKSVVGMTKLDGLTCSLRYLKGTLVSAETRGNGEIGEDILHNALIIKNIPNRIPYREELVVDGEVICTKEDFEEFSDKYANPRNFAAGSIRLLDSKECEKRKLRFVVWNVIIGPEDTVIDNLNAVEKMGFEVTPWTSSWDWDAKDFLIEEANKKSYPIDGLVGRFNDIKYGESLGTTGHHSKAAYAFKFYDETYPTYLKGIEWTMGRTAVLTPVAVFEPIEIEDSVVERASLHNISIMEELLGTPYVGQKVEVFKANMIIPQIASAESPSKEDVEFISIPTICPICHHSTLKVKDNDSEVLKCTNPNCEGRFINKVDHFVGKKGLDIKGLSKMTLEKLMVWGWLENISDIFILKNHREEWIKKPGFGVKSVDNILNAIEESASNCNLSNYIAALGIPLIGTTVSKDLIKYFKTWDDFQKAILDKYRFFNLPNFGVEMHNSIINFDYTEANEIANKYIHFIAVEEIIEEEVNTEINGKIFVITGNLTHFANRNELKDLIEQKGGKVVGSISGKTNYLINNDINSTSSKNISAKKLNIPIITEENFLKMI